MPQYNHFIHTYDVNRPTLSIILCIYVFMFSPAINSDHNDAWYVETNTAGYNGIRWCQI